MITADVIKCTIPSENALKANELYCNVAYPVASADSTTWATWATALFTLLLAVFALFAWNTAKKTLGKMEEQIRTQEQRVINERQQEHLQTYMRDLDSLLSNAVRPKANIDELLDRSASSWMIWSVGLIESESAFRILTKGIDLQIGSLAGTVHREKVQNAQKRSLRKGAVSTFSHFELWTVAHTYMEALMQWQMNPKRRNEMSIKLRSISNELEKKKPLPKP